MLILIKTRGEYYFWRFRNYGICPTSCIGAKMGDPSREVVAIIGDGGFQMNIQELGTIFQTQNSG